MNGFEMISPEAAPELWRMQKKSLVGRRPGAMSTKQEEETGDLPAIIALQQRSAMESR